MNSLKMPPPCAVDFHVPCYLLQATQLAANVNLHGPSPWHPKKRLSDLFRSNHRETPPDKPVASLRVFTQPCRGRDCVSVCAACGRKDLNNPPTARWSVSFVTVVERVVERI